MEGSCFPGVQVDACACAWEVDACAGEHEDKKEEGDDGRVIILMVVCSHTAPDCLQMFMRGHQLKGMRFCSAGTSIHLPSSSTTSSTYYLNN